MIENYVAS